MATFQEIGAYLDKLYTDGKFDLMGKIVEDLICTKINVPSPDDLKWLSCSPRLNYSCIKLTKENVASVRAWLLGEAGFDQADHESYGIDTEYGQIKWDEWIVQEDNGATVFYTEDDFKKCYCTW